jgi:hypothetical protein
MFPPRARRSPLPGHGNGDILQDRNASPGLRAGQGQANAVRIADDEGIESRKGLEVEGGPRPDTHPPRAAIDNSFRLYNRWPERNHFDGYLPQSDISLQRQST